MKKYKTIYADPPWPEQGGGKIKRGADRHYSLMEVGEIKEMADFIEELIHPVGAHLYLWTTNNYLKEGLEILEVWGFEYITTITWVKKQMGLGQYYRGLTEHCLFGATPERLPYRELENGKRAQGKTAFIEEKGEYSEKPEQMRRWIEKVSHPPRIELFARERIKGWDVWGDEVDSDIVKTRIKDFIGGEEIECEVIAKKNRIVLKGEGYEEGLKKIQQSLQDAGSYYIDEDTEEWSVTIEGLKVDKNTIFTECPKCGYKKAEQHIPVQRHGEVYCPKCDEVF